MHRGRKRHTARADTPSLQRNASSLPNLAQLARIYLAADGSLAATDAVFATAGKACSTAGSVGFDTMRKMVMSRMLREAGYDPEKDLGPKPERARYEEDGSDKDEDAEEYDSNEFDDEEGDYEEEANRRSKRLRT